MQNSYFKALFNACKEQIKGSSQMRIAIHFLKFTKYEDLKNH